MKIFKIVCYSLALISTSVMFCSQPANEFEKMDTLRLELKNNCQNMVNLRQALKPDSDLAFFRDLQTICQSQQQRLKDFRSQHIICQQTGKLSANGDQSLKYLIDTLSPLIEEAAQEAIELLQKKQELINEQIGHDIAQKGTQLIAECDKISAPAAICTNLNAAALANGCTPLAATTISLCTATLVERTAKVEAKHAAFKSELQTYLYKPALSELQSNDSKQTEN
ncbi:MAG: hypothetical protein P4L31_02745 [Candidatus Babeliales bacterium]|nr:hypothetical protein [Candidatus Babeliales bacterium]